MKLGASKHEGANRTDDKSLVMGKILSPDLPVEPVESRVNYLNAEFGIKSWLLTKDHKRIALSILDR